MKPVGFLILSFAAAALAQQAPPEAAQIFEQMRETYSKLQSYADTGEVMTEYKVLGAPGIVEHHTFRTFYHAPRQFLFHFQKDPKAGKEEYVIWCEGAEFHSWWSTTRVNQKYEQGRGTLAFATGSLPTKGSALQIAPLLFSQSGLKGPVFSLNEPQLAGTETVNGKRCYKLFSETRASGLGEEQRATTVWIDTQNMLVLKVFEDTPAGSGTGNVNHITTLFKPQPNPELKAEVFRFVPK